MAATQGPAFPKSIVVFAAAALFLFTVVFLLQFAPRTLFPGEGWKGKGLRLLRDDYEISLYGDRSEWVARHGVPYSEDFPQEYPPLGMLAITWPRFLTNAFPTFEGYLQVQFAVFYGLLAACTAALLARFGRRRLLLAFFLLPAFLYFSLWRFDALPAFLASAALLAVAGGWYGAAVLALWAAILAKLYPVFFAVPLAMYLWPRRREPALRGAWSAFIAVMAVTVALAGVAALRGIRPLDTIIGYHFTRGFEVGSMRQALASLLGRAGLAGSAVDAAVKWSCTALQYLAVPYLLWRAEVRDLRAAVRACVFLLIPFMAFGTFFSEQWIIWLTPILILVATPVELALLAALDLALYLQFPVLYDLSPLSWHYDLATWVRTALLLALWLASARAIPWRSRRAAAATAP